MAKTGSHHLRNLGLLITGVFAFLLAFIGIEPTWQWGEKHLRLPPMTDGIRVVIALSGFVLLIAGWLIYFFHDHRKALVKIEKLEADAVPSLEQKIRDWLYKYNHPVQKLKDDAAEFLLVCTLSNGHFVNIGQVKGRDQFVYFYHGRKLEGDELQALLKLPKETQEEFIEGLSNEVAAMQFTYHDIRRTNDPLVRIERRLGLDRISEESMFETLDLLGNGANRIVIYMRRFLYKSPGTPV